MGYGWVKRILPRTLFARTLLIIVMPVILAQVATTFVFFDRHWSTVTRRLAEGLAGDVGMITELLREDRSPTSLQRVARLAHEQMAMTVRYDAGNRIPARKGNWLNPALGLLEEVVDTRLREPFVARIRSGTITMMVQLPYGVLTLKTSDRRIQTPTTAVFIAWMLGSSVVLSIIALLFMRNQIRPIRRLAAAAEEFGKGRDVPSFKPEGATEVRQAAAALLVMRDRLIRQITQRTEMLAGVSHDLRTPLTRMKLQLALMPETPEIVALRADVAEMATMVDAYLAFARGEEAEAPAIVDLEILLQEVVAGVRHQETAITLKIADMIQLPMRRQAMKRCLTNLVGNAARHGTIAQVTATQQGRMVHVFVDDDGPGIPIDQREAVFRPFKRLDESRNAATGGVGLGLTIARDIARLHGGDILLSDSPLGGLRAHLRLPA